MTTANDNDTSSSDESPDWSIRLDQFLKTTGITGTGGQAKILIQSGQVKLNGEVEIRRRKQLKLGDEVELLGEIFKVEEDEAMDESLE